MKILFTFSISVSLLYGIGKTGYKSSLAPQFRTEIHTKEKMIAFTILQSKCNGCHIKKNPRMSFTLENMAGFSTKINKQVFVTKRMPKGNTIKLTESDGIKLKNWLNTLK